LGNIVAAWYHTNGKNKTRVSFYKRSANTDGYIQLRVYNTSGLGEYVTLTTTDDVKAGTEQVGTALVFANNTSWQSSRVSAWFDHTAIDVNGGLQIEFKNVSNYPCDIWIDGVQLEPNETKFPYIYSDGQYSSPNAIVNSKTAGSSTPTYLSIWAGTQAEYTAIVTKDPATLYFVTT
jgi:hypothetical protein